MTEHEPTDSGRKKTRLSTIFGGQISQAGKSRTCTISDVSVQGAKIKTREPLKQYEKIHLVFNRLGDYRALEGKIVWQEGNVVGIQFISSEAQVAKVIAALMPNRWRLIQENNNDA